MAGSINLGSIGGDDGLAVFSLNYDDQNRVTSFNGINNSPNDVQGRIVGWAADGTEDATNKTFALLLTPGQADSVSVPANGAKAFSVSVNAHGKLSGFNTYLG